MKYQKIGLMAALLMASLLWVAQASSPGDVVTDSQFESETVTGSLFEPEIVAGGCTYPPSYDPDRVAGFACEKAEVARDPVDFLTLFFAIV